MPHSFFHLAPRHDPEIPHLCADCAEMIAEEPEAERKANMDAAIALGDVLFDAINIYTETHEDTSYRHIFEALAYLRWCLQRELDEDSTDA